VRTGDAARRRARRRRRHTDRRLRSRRARQNNGGIAHLIRERSADSVASYDPATCTDSSLSADGILRQTYQ